MRGIISLYHSFLRQVKIWKNLLPKINDTVNQKTYRPITSLSATCKLLTSIITERMYVLKETNELFPIDTKDCKGGSYGRKDQLLINRMIIEDCI